jgi:hypothetical protein
MFILVTKKKTTQKDEKDKETFKLPKTQNPNRVLHIKPP